MRYLSLPIRWCRAKLSSGAPRNWLTALLFLACALLTSCFSMSEPLASDARTPLSAREAWELAAPELLDWQPNLTLVYARSLAAPDTREPADLPWDGRYSEWSFLACAKGTDQCKSVLVNASTGLIQSAIPSQEFRRNVAPLALRAWRVDSDKAVAIAMDQGLREWATSAVASAPESPFTLRLQLIAQSYETAHWHIVTAIGQKAVEVTVSADDGSILSWVEPIDCAICGY